MRPEPRVWQNTAARALPDADKARMTAELTPPPEPGETLTRRISVPVCGAGAPAAWFDVTVERKTCGQVVFANDVSALVAAETAQQRFVQTLGKTFADLPTGLAVFDRAKTLAMFNPALIDLTGLQVEFLSARPEIVTFFDMLRDRQVMPEPKNYASWRSQINDMVSAAHGGHYREMWSLANGQSYRVTGRPHPDGAVAFLFEDISSEISETRHHRGEMALRNALLDQLDAAIAVLSQDRRVIYANRAFGDSAGGGPGRAPCRHVRAGRDGGLQRALSRHDALVRNRAPDHLERGAGPDHRKHLAGRSGVRGSICGSRRWGRGARCSLCIGT